MEMRISTAQKKLKKGLCKEIRVKTKARAKRLGIPVQIDSFFGGRGGRGFLCRGFCYYRQFLYSMYEKRRWRAYLYTFVGVHICSLACTLLLGCFGTRQSAGVAELAATH